MEVLYHPRVPVEADLVIELREIAHAPSDATSFPLKYDGVTFYVEYSGGSTSSLTLRAKYDSVAKAAVAPAMREAHYRESAKGGSLSAIRPMSIALRSETGADRMAKDEGINREHQTGVKSFDEDVYIDSPTVDAVVLNAVLSEPVRAASVELLSLAFDWVTIDDKDGDVTAVLSAFLKLRDETDCARRIVRAFAALLGGLPPVARASGEHAKRSSAPKVFAVIGGIALIASPFLMFAIADACGCAETDGEATNLKAGCGTTPLVAIVFAVTLGLVVSFIARAIATPRMRGDSDSAARIATVAVAAFLWIAIPVFLTVAAIGFGMHGNR